MKYAQLSDEAKAKAREWWKELEAQDWDGTRLYEDMATCLSFLGIAVAQSMRGNNIGRLEYEFEWEGFGNQSSGLVFEGGWHAEGVDLDKLLDHAPQDTVLAGICTSMTALKLKWPQCQATITTVIRGAGLASMFIDETTTDSNGDDDPLPNEDRNALLALVKAACRWCYDNLESNYEYDTSDEAAAENIEANDYEFHKDGRIKPERRVAA